MITALKTLDLSLLHFINVTLSNPIFDAIMPIITDQQIMTVPMILLWLALMIFGGKRGRIAGILLLICVGLTDFVAAQILKPWIGRIRPSHEIGDVINLLVDKGGKYGFPSNHAANTFAAATTLSYFFIRWKITLYTLAIVIAFSRIYVGVHYPGDVMGGAILGYIITQGILGLWFLVSLREVKQGRNWVLY